MEQVLNNYVIRILTSADEVNATEWNQLLNTQEESTPFMRYEYLAALQASGSATPETGWTERYLLLERDGVLVSALAATKVRLAADAVRIRHVVLLVDG